MGLRTLKASLLLPLPLPLPTPLLPPLPLAGLRARLLDAKEKGEVRALMWVERG